MQWTHTHSCVTYTRAHIKPHVIRAQISSFYEMYKHIFTCGIRISVYYKIHTHTHSFVVHIHI